MVAAMCNRNVNDRENFRNVEANGVWVEWSLPPKRPPIKLSNMASAVVIMTASLQLANVPMV